MVNKVQTSNLGTPHAGAPSGLSRWFGGQSLARLAGFGVVIFIAWTLLSMVMPPMFFRSSKRAVVDVPATLVTTPIEGVVTSQRLHVGDRFHAGDALAEIQNQNVDRSTLVELTSKKVELTQQYDAVSTQLDASRVRLATADQQMGQYQAATQKINDANVSAIRSKLAIANTQIDAQQDIVNRDSTLAAAGAISGSVSDTSKYQQPAGRRADHGQDQQRQVRDRLSRYARTGTAGPEGSQGQCPRRPAAGGNGLSGSDGHA